MALTVTDSLKGMEYTLRPSIYQTKDNREEEINEVAEQGKVMLTGIIYASDEIKGIVGETLLPYVKQKKETDNSA